MSCPTKQSLCLPLIAKYNIQPGVSWGSLSSQPIKDFLTGNCRITPTCSESFASWGITSTSLANTPDWAIANIIQNCPPSSGGNWTLTLINKYNVIPYPFTGATWGSAPSGVIQDYMSHNLTSCAEVKSRYNIVTPTSFGTAPRWGIEYVLHSCNEAGWTPLLMTTFNIQYPADGYGWNSMSSWGSATSYIQTYVQNNPPSASSLMSQYGMVPPSNFGTAKDWAIDQVLAQDTTGAWSSVALAVKYNIVPGVSWGSANNLDNVKTYTTHHPATCQQLIDAYNMSVGQNFGTASDWAIELLISLST